MLSHVRPYASMRWTSGRVRSASACAGPCPRLWPRRIFGRFAIVRSGGEGHLGPDRAHGRDSGTRNPGPRSLPPRTVRVGTDVAGGTLPPAGDSTEREM